MKIPNIKYCGDYLKIILDKDNPEDCITMYKDRDSLHETDVYNKYVKKCEAMVRRSREYKEFVNYIKKTLGINFCQITSNIFDEDAKIEMHHGPLLTLYDYCAIMINYFIDTCKPISTFYIADAVIQEHFDLHVSVVMAAVTNHEAIHNRDVFINIKQGIGNMNEFINKYSNYLNDEHKYKIWNYVYMCKSNDSYHDGVLDLTSETIKNITL